MFVLFCNISIDYRTINFPDVQAACFKVQAQCQRYIKNDFAELCAPEPRFSFFICFNTRLYIKSNRFGGTLLATRAFYQSCCWRLFVHVFPYIISFLRDISFGNKRSLRLLKSVELTSAYCSVAIFSKLENAFISFHEINCFALLYNCQCIQLLFDNNVIVYFSFLSSKIPISQQMNNILSKLKYLEYKGGNFYYFISC